MNNPIHTSMAESPVLYKNDGLNMLLTDLVQQYDNSMTVKKSSEELQTGKGRGGVARSTKMSKMRRVHFMLKTSQRKDRYIKKKG